MIQFAGAALRGEVGRRSPADLRQQAGPGHGRQGRRHHRRHGTQGHHRPHVADPAVRGHHRRGRQERHGVDVSKRQEMKMKKRIVL